MIKTLIVGNKGFIGSHLFDYFSKNFEMDVWACDVVADYVSKKYFLIDASNSDFEEIFRYHQFDFCINCSGSANVPDSLLHPARDFYLNTLNVFNLLDSIRKYCPSCKFLNISSAAVYGNPVKIPIEETSIVQPISPYGFHKWQSEILATEFHQIYGLHTCSLRVFSAYGNGLRKQLFWDLAQKMKSAEEVVLFGSGKETRDFIHVADIALAIERICFNGSFNADIYNVGNGIEISILSAAEIMNNALGFANVIVFSGGIRPGDPLNWCADVTKIKKLNYRQTITMELGLEKYVEWLKENKLV